MSPVLKFITISIVIFSCWHTAFAQSATEPMSPVCFPYMQYKDLHSAVVGDDFRIYCSFPPGYDTATGKFPVLYLTDGDWNLTTAINCFSSLRQDYITTEALIVAIGYGQGKNQRSRDLDPAAGADKFLAFIATELIPYVELHFKASRERVLYGYSLGGLFSSYVLFRQPELFNAILIGAPGDNGTGLIPGAKKYLQSHAALHPRIFIGAGSFELENVRNIERFEKYLTARQVPSSQFETVVSPGLGHGAAVSAVMQNAIRFAFCRRFQPVGLSGRQLGGYIGMYARVDAPDKTFRIAYQSGSLRLLLKGSGEDTLAYQLIPASDSSLFMREAPDQLIVLPKKSAGQASVLKVVRKDQSLLYKKLDGQ